MTSKAERKRPIKRKPRKASAAPITLYTPGDRGATGPANRERLVEEERGDLDPDTGKVINPNRYRGNRRHPWVERYAKQGRLSKDQLAAAIRLFSAYEGFPARDPIAALSGAVDRSAWVDDPLAVKVDQRRWFYQMWAAVPQSSRPIVEHVVLKDMAVRSMAGCVDGHSAQLHIERLKAGLDAIP